MSSSYRLELDRWLAGLDVKAETVLDVGGSQLPIKGRTKSWDVEQYLIVDLPEPHVGSPKPDIAFNLELDTWRGNYAPADVVFCLEVMDYLIRPDRALMNIKYMLWDGGTAYVTWPFIYPTHQPLEAEGFRYTQRSIERLAELSGLTITSMTPRRPETDLLDQFYRAERMRAAKRYDHHVTGWMTEFTREPGN